MQTQRLDPLPGVTGPAAHELTAQLGHKCFPANFIICTHADLSSVITYLKPPVPESLSCMDRSHTRPKQSSCRLQVLHACKPQQRDHLPEAPGPAAPELAVQSLCTNMLQASITYQEPAFPQRLSWLYGWDTNALHKYLSSARFACMQTPAA